MCCALLAIGMHCAKPLRSWADEQENQFTAEQLEFFEAKVRPLLVEHCFACHSQSADKVQAGLLLDSRKGILKGGESGTVLVVGMPNESPLIKAVRYEGTEMPPDRKLTNDQIEILVKWVEQGVAWPPESTSEGAMASKRPTVDYSQVDWQEMREQHWAWKPIKQPALPMVHENSWIQTPIDAFVLSGLEAVNMAPNPPAEPNILLRRMHIDLIGIPPTVAETKAFIESYARDRTKAIEDAIDALLASPAYGQRWARHWLDVARYSDGFGGFLDTGVYPHAWRYRDWVIDALNSDMPWADFIRLQLAGDIIGKPKDHVATGFFALGPSYQSDGGDPDSIAQAKGETLDDRVDTLTRGMLGITVSCARCHDHKFDPIPQQDYYSLAGIFNNTTEQARPIADADTARRYTEARTQLDNAEKELREAMAVGEKDKRELTADEQAVVAERKGKRDEFAKDPILNIPFCHTMVETGSADMKVALRGNLRKEGEVAPRRFLRIVTGANPTPFLQGSGRKELAEALVASGNPLTSRVFANRIWMHHFGEAIVRTPSNFGKLGQMPTHPELLDWLALQLVGNAPDRSGSIKSLHRIIMKSATYQMSSHQSLENYERDGDNRLLWRMNPRRMDVESWRDSLLAVTDELDLSPGQPPINDLNRSVRRTIYSMVSRNGDQFASDTFLRTFDFPLMRATVENRPQSIVPQQFLFLLNSEFIVNRAKAFASRLSTMANNDEQRIEQAYLILHGRTPSREERSIAIAYLSEAQDVLADSSTKASLSNWERYVQVLLSSNEFMFVR